MKNLDTFYFEEAKKDDMEALSALAAEIWPVTFANILSKEQIQYMLNWMYVPEKLGEQQKNGHLFYFLLNHEEKIGFIGLERNVPSEGFLRIHKLYLKPNYHGQGLGKLMLKKIEEIADQHALLFLHLNVNRFNEAVNFYQKAGFKTIKMEDIEIGEGYLMEDFVMLKKLRCIG